MCHFRGIRFVYCFRLGVAPVLPPSCSSRRFDEEGRLLLDLGDTVAKMKRDFGVDQVLAWHAMVGYWAGVEPEAPEMAPFEPRATKLLAPKGIREVDPEVSSAGTVCCDTCAGSTRRSQGFAFSFA